MQYKYSPSTNLFYLVGLHKTIPDDAKNVASCRYAEIMNGSGAWVSDVNGEPVEVQREQVIFTLEQLAKSAIAAVNAEYTKRMGAIADAYPLHERESWPVQLQEARMVMDYVDANVPVPETVQTPWIEQCAAQRGLTREELAARIVAKDGGYRQVSGFLSGVRQKHEDEIDALLAAGVLSREALQNYWYLEGWDVEPATDLQTPQPT